MGERRWIDIDWDSCPDCGGDVAVFTARSDGTYGMDDPVRCTECPATGVIDVNDSDEDVPVARIVWTEVTP